MFGNLVKAIKDKDMTVRVVTFYHDIKASLYPQWIKHAKWVNKIEYTVGIRQERDQTAERLIARRSLMSDRCN